MPIKVKCRNDECGAVLRVKDEAAGKKVRCPKCKGIIPVPAPEPEEELDELDDLEEVEDTRTKKKSRSRKATASAKRRSRDDEDDDYDEDEDDRPRKKKPKKLQGFDGLSKIYFGCGLGLSFVILVIPFLSWVSSHAKGANGEVAMSMFIGGMGKISTEPPLPDRVLERASFKMQASEVGGIQLLIVGGAVVLFLVATYLIAFIKGADAPLTNSAMKWGSMTGTAAGVMFLIWGMALIWRTQSIAKEGLGGDIPYGIPLIVIVGVGVLMLYFFNNVSIRFTGKLWANLAMAAGLLLGGVMMLMIQPWDGEAFVQAFKEATP